MNVPGTSAATPSPRVQAGEWQAVVVSFAYFFCLLTAYYVMRPVREQLTAAVGSTQLPWFYAATFIATLALAPVFGGLVARFPRRVVVPAVYGFFIACLVAFIPLFTHQGLISPRALGMVFFVWVSVFNLFVVSVFWSFMSDIWSEAQARRLFPIVAIAGTLGAMTGPILTRALVDVIGVAPLLGVSAALAAPCSWGAGRGCMARAATTSSTRRPSAAACSMACAISSPRPSCARWRCCCCWPTASAP
jgi:AAA family ATP:ADP antiporter